MSRFLISDTDLVVRLGDVVVLDCRTAEEYAEGHIPGAVHFDPYSYLCEDSSADGLARWHEDLTALIRGAGLTGTESAILYESDCGMRAARGLWMLHYAGIDSARVLKGGLNEWRYNGHGVDPIEEEADPSEFVLHPQADLIATMEDVCSGSLQMIDARSEEEYRGEKTASCCARTGRVPGATWIPWEVFRSEDGATVRAPWEVRASLVNEGIDPDQPIGVYCHRGARSAFVWLATRNAGIRTVRNFHGSWHEYAGRADLVAERG
jgi:thiosulfate/3-mercaptopyruvate sulfurtransferase